MSGSKDLNLSLWECGGIRSPADLAAIMMALRPLGLAAGSGAFTATDTPHPVEDLTTDIANPWVSEQGKQAEEAGTLIPTQTVKQWPWALVHMERPQTRGNIFITQRGVAAWDILISVRTFSHALLGISADEFTDDWAKMLERLGNLLYDRTRPALAILTATGENEYECSAATVEQRQLVVGWRTWYGPAYVEKFGFDWLVGLPDHTQLQSDGCVAHALDVPLTAIVHGDPSAYDRVWPYLDQAQVEPAWPRRRKQRTRKGPFRDNDAASARVRADIRGLLNMTIELGGRERLKILPVPWAQFSGLERAVAIETVREILQMELVDYEDALVRLETSELPDELRVVLDDLANASGRLTYVVKSTLSPPPVDASRNNTESQ